MKCLKKILAIATICLFLAIPSKIAHAEGGAWGGFGGGVSGSDDWGGGYTDCSDTDTYVRSLDCNYTSWVYYEYAGGAANEGKSVTFEPTSNDVNDVISGECAKEGFGFWHFGYNAWYNEDRSAGKYISPVDGNYGKVNWSTRNVEYWYWITDRPFYA